MTEPNIPILDEVVWHDIITNPIMYIEDCGLEGVRWRFVAHLVEVEEPNKDVDNDHLLEGDSFEPLWEMCWKCWQSANDKIAKEMLGKVFDDKSDDDK